MKINQVNASNSISVSIRTWGVGGGGRVREKVLHLVPDDPPSHRYDFDERPPHTRMERHVNYRER